MNFNYIEAAIEKNRYLFFCFVAGIVAFSTNLTNQLFDSNSLFHEGEYVGLLWGMRSYYAGATEFPLLIHGAMDYIPSLLASFIYGDSHVIVGTRVINTIIVWICWVFFLDLCYQLIAASSQRKLWMLVTLFIFFVVSPPLFSTALVVEQSFIGSRDLFILMAVWSFSKYTNSTTNFATLIYLSFGSASAVTALFWSYDRGVMSLVFFAAILSSSILNKKPSHALIASFIALCSLLLIEYSNFLGSFVSNLNNVTYWIKYSAEIWGKGFNEFPIAMKMTIINLVVFCLLSTSIIVINIKDKSDEAIRFILIGLILIQILLLKTALNRPGVTRLSWVLWPSIIMMLYSGSRLFSELNLSIQVVYKKMGSMDFLKKKKTKIVFIGTSILFVLYLTPSFLPYAAFAKNLVKPKINAEVVSEEVVKVGSVLKQHGVECFLGWSNEGVISVMAEKRFCTAYPYAIYVSRNAEVSLLEQIKKESPSVVAFNPDAWAMNIDRSMALRLPQVSQYIQENYPKIEKIDGYWILSK